MYIVYGRMGPPPFLNLEGQTDQIATPCLDRPAAPCSCIVSETLASVMLCTFAALLLLSAE